MYTQKQKKIKIKPKIKLNLNIFTVNQKDSVFSFKNGAVSIRKLQSYFLL